MGFEPEPTALAEGFESGFDVDFDSGAGGDAFRVGAAARRQSSSVQITDFVSVTRSTIEIPHGEDSLISSNGLNRPIAITTNAELP